MSFSGRLLDITDEELEAMSARREAKKAAKMAAARELNYLIERGPDQLNYTTTNFNPINFTSARMR